MKHLHISFAILLPLINLALWVVLIPIPATFLYFGLHQEAQRAGKASIHVGDYTVTIPADRVLWFAVNSAASRHSELITAFNIPGGLVSALVSLPISWPEMWYPRKLTWGAWRALSFPFFCLPVWMFVGTGLDRFLRKQRIHWSLLVFGTLLCLVFLVAFVGFRFCVSANDRIEDDWLVWGFGLWAFLFGVFPFVWLGQGRLLAKEHFSARN